LIRRIARELLTFLGNGCVWITRIRGQEIAETIRLNKRQCATASLQGVSVFAALVLSIAAAPIRAIGPVGNVASGATNTVQHTTGSVTQAVRKPTGATTQSAPQTTGGAPTAAANKPVVAPAAPVMQTVSRVTAPVTQTMQSTTQTTAHITPLGTGGAPPARSNKPAVLRVTTSATQAVQTTVQNTSQTVHTATGSVMQQMTSATSSGQSVVTSVVQLVAQAVAPATRPVVATVAPVAQPIENITTTVTQPVTPPIASVAPPVTAPVAPTAPIAPVVPDAPVAPVVHHAAPIAPAAPVTAPPTVEPSQVSAPPSPPVIPVEPQPFTASVSATATMQATQTAIVAVANARKYINRAERDDHTIVAGPSAGIAPDAHFAPSANADTIIFSPSAKEICVNGHLVDEVTGVPVGNAWTVSADASAGEPAAIPANVIAVVNVTAGANGVATALDTFRDVPPSESGLSPCSSLSATSLPCRKLASGI